ncbi:MAG: type II toxin-antitoxin system HicA family toxin [Vicinamibacteria bacterium]|nr:type II toxin-antitoxin system HicA family toxin [Vicinamibacteria bacterium]
MQLTGSDLLDQLHRRGCIVVRQRGSHVRVRCGTCVTTIPVHAGESLPPGTIGQVRRDLSRCLGKGWLQ